MVTQRQNSMRNWAVVLAGLAIVVAACGGSDTSGGSASSAMPPTSADPTTTQGPVESDAGGEVMAIALAQLVTVDTTFGSGHRFVELLVQDHVDPAAGTAAGGPGPGRELTPSERGVIETTLTGISPMRWISDPDEWRTDELQPVVVGAAIVGVGEPEFQGAEALVPVSMWCGGLCGTWLTYRVGFVDGAWAVLDVEGPIAVS